ncbi:TRAP transporter substrate-binding protein [Cetobacterium sp.]|uniref:TRAP transporter substrate-binding protein n=1 Tax=Cetobacterium sp. TaxID=2071632 RepID=UPI003EE4AF41
MRKFFNLFLFLFIATVSFSFFGSKEKTVEWKLGHNANTDHIWHETAVEFSEAVETKTNGKVKVKIFPNGQLGSETDMINSVRLGTLDMVLTGETLQNWAPKAALMAVPYAFRDLNHMNTVLNGEIGQEIKENIQTNAGLIPLYYHERAPRNLTTNREIKSVGDLKGMIIRVPDVPIFVKTWEKLEAKPTPMSLQEVFTSLQQNTIHAQENPYDLIYSLGFYEVQKYAYETEHVIQWIYATVGEKQFNKLTPEQQTAVLEAAEEAQLFAQGKFQEFITTSRQNLLDKGMKIVSVNKEEYQNKIMPEMQNILTPEQYELYLKIVNTK